MLASIDPVPARQALDAQKAQLRAAEAQLDKAKDSPGVDDAEDSLSQAKDILSAVAAGKHHAAIADLMRPPEFVPESKRVAELLPEMQRRKFHITLVTDEFGSTSGLVTLDTRAWHEVEVLKFVHRHFILDRADIVMYQRGLSRALTRTVRDRMIVFGGEGTGSVSESYADTWALALGDSAAWTEITPADRGPEGRSAHVAVYDPARDRMLIHGGLDYQRRNVLADTWSLPLGGGSWQVAVDGSTLPPADY